MDGTGHMDIVSVKIATPHGIAVDLVAQRVYWTDSSLQLIESARYDGRNRTTLARGVDVSFQWFRCFGHFWEEVDLCPTLFSLCHLVTLDLDTLCLCLLQLFLFHSRISSQLIWLSLLTLTMLFVV